VDIPAVRTDSSAAGAGLAMGAGETIRAGAGAATAGFRGADGAIAGEGGGPNP
jgi:hypothetical protein